MSTRIINGDSLEILKSMADESVNCVITSPPYYGLRDYGVDGQIGLEETPEEYINSLVAIFREVKRVLKKDGTLWLNIGDSYAGSGKGAWSNKQDQKEVYVPDADSPQAKMKKTFEGIKAKDLIGIPWMLAFALRADGWYLRQDIIWAKPNAMPESTRDRCTKSHEYIFLLSKSSKYYFDFESIMEPRIGMNNDMPAGSKGAFGPCQSRYRASGNKERKPRPTPLDHLCGSVPYVEGNPLKRKRDVWNIATKPYKEAHFATFPEALVEPCLLAGCPDGGTALDPFAGAGTVGVVCKKQGKNFIGIELNPEYATLATKRIENTEISTNKAPENEQIPGQMEISV